MKQEQEKPIGPTAGPLGIPPPPSFHPINWDAYGRGHRESTLYPSGPGMPRMRCHRHVRLGIIFGPCARARASRFN